MVNVVNNNFKDWKKFLITDIFHIKNTHSILKKQIIENSGIYPYVTAKEGNNSVESYISFDMKYIEEGNSILIGGKTLVISYQKNDYFSNDSHNLALYLKDNTKRTKNIQLFLVASLKSSLSSLYTWGDSISKRSIVNDYVLLPSLNGSDPDWFFIDSYMSDIEITTKEYLNDLKHLIKDKKESINLQNWKEFHIYDLFKINSGTKFDRSKMDTSKEVVNFVGRSNFNNGITAKVDIFNNTEPYSEGSLTLALGGAYLGSCFIQTAPFYTSQNVVVLTPKTSITWEAKQFIATAIFIESQNNYKAFIKELNTHIKKDFSFMLPTTNNGDPDFDYMTDYMQNIQEKVSNDYKDLKSIL